MTAKTYPLPAVFENSTTLLGETGLADLTISAWKILKTDSTDQTLIVDEEDVDEEIGLGAYVYQSPLVDIELYDILFAVTTASADVISKRVWGYRWNDVIPWAVTAAAFGLPVDGSNLTLINRVSYSAEITGLTIPADWESFYLTVKVSEDDDDEDAILQVLVTATSDAGDGIQYVNKAAATTTEKTYGSLVVDQGAGTVTLAVSDDMVFDNTGKYSYDLKYFYPDDDSAKPAESANFTIQNTETHAINPGA